MKKRSLGAPFTEAPIAAVPILNPSLLYINWVKLATTG
jgi:hypothetical protein